MPTGATKDASSRWWNKRLGWGISLWILIMTTYIAIKLILWDSPATTWIGIGYNIGLMLSLIGLGIKIAVDNLITLPRLRMEENLSQIATSMQQVGNNQQALYKLYVEALEPLKKTNNLGK